MYIMIDKKFGIKSDDNNFILFQLKVYGSKSKRCGENYIETIGYFNSFERILRVYMKMALMSDTKLTTLTKVLAKLTQINKLIKIVNKKVDG